jgi:hypothetical protein
MTSDCRASRAFRRTRWWIFALISPEYYSTGGSIGYDARRWSSTVRSLLLYEADWCSYCEHYFCDGSAAYYNSRLAVKTGPWILEFHLIREVPSARLTLHSTKLCTKVKIFRKKIFFGTDVTSEAFLSVSETFKVTRLQGCTQTKLWTCWRNFDLSRSFEHFLELGNGFAVLQ